MTPRWAVASYAFVSTRPVGAAPSGVCRPIRAPLCGPSVCPAASGATKKKARPCT